MYSISLVAVYRCTRYISVVVERNNFSYDVFGVVLAFIHFGVQ